MATTTPLHDLGRPLFHRVDDDLGLEAPAPRLDHAQRMRVRQLAGMQREGLVTSDATGATWRVASDEGDYLDGDDVAPNPLAFMAAGLASSYAAAVETRCGERGLAVDDLAVTVDSFYTMAGSALRGDLTGGALDPGVSVAVAADADADVVREVVEAAVGTAPVTGLLRGEHRSRFGLLVNDETVAPDRVAALDDPPERRGADAFDAVTRDGEGPDPPLYRHTGETTPPYDGERDRYTRGQGSSLAETQDRVLHVQGALTRRDGGCYDVTVRNFSPQGSVFELLAAGPGETADPPRAPDPLAFVAAGIGFCFMTQIGRYVDIVGRELTDFRAVQDTHLAAGTDGDPPAAEPVETLVLLETPEGDAFAREVLDMAEQTCFLHALCRTDLAPDLQVDVA